MRLLIGYILIDIFKFHAHFMKLWHKENFTARTI